MLYYFVVFVVLLGVELLYFRVANYFNIIDKPNERSSHSRITLRGGGIVFYVGALVYFVISGFSFPWFMLGLTLIAGVSFVDDVRSVTQRVRLVVHFMAMLLMFYQWGMLALPWWYVVVALVVCTGIINAYNFMDGINGITEGNRLFCQIGDSMYGSQLHFFIVKLADTLCEMGKIKRNIVADIPPRQCQHSPLVKHQ